MKTRSPVEEEGAHPPGVRPREPKRPAADNARVIGRSDRRERSEQRGDPARGVRGQRSLGAAVEHAA